MTYVIVGAGAAGMAAAETLRQLDAESSVAVFSDEEDWPYYRPSVSYFLAGAMEAQDFLLQDPDWFRRNRIELHLGEQVLAVDPTGKKITTSRGTYPFGRLLLAIGSTPVLPPISGITRPETRILRTLEDARRLRSLAAPGQRVLAIGAGLLGLEAAAGLARRGAEVRVVEMANRVLPRQLDTRAARIVQGRLEEQGLQVLLGARVLALEDAGPKGAAAPSQGGVVVRLSNGESWIAHSVLVAAGVRVPLELAKQAGLATNRGILVDDALRTSVPDIFAAGDCVEHRGQVYGLWTVAQEQGRLAAQSMAGQPVAYSGSVPATTLKVAGVDLYSFGDIDAEDSPEKQRHVVEDPAVGVYRKLVARDGRLVGGILVGNLDHQWELSEAAQQGVPMEQALPWL